MPALRLLDPQEVARLYVDEKRTIAEICAHFFSGYRQVVRALAQAGVSTRKSGPRDREHSRRTLKDRVFDKAGYALVKRPEHHRSNSSGYVREHILVMEAKLGHPIPSGMDVHHKDEDKQNNHPDNLELFQSRGEHIRFHNFERSSAKKLHLLTDDELRALYSRLSTPQIAKEFQTSPASVQRELVRRGMNAGQGRRPQGAVDSRKLLGSRPIVHLQPAPDAGA